MQEPLAIAATEPKKPSFTRPLIFILVVAVLFLVGRIFNLQDYLQEERLRQLMTAYGLWAPLVFLLIWAIAPVLLLPGLPLALAGGVLFGPVWGVIYSAVGSTIGASLAFLTARYLARDWVAAKLRGSRLAHLDDQVARRGWKIVALSRLIGLPFFLLNYAFGLTCIPFLPYAIATCFAMLPWIIAFVLVSSNLLALLQGQVSIWLIIGVFLVVLVGLLPLIIKKVRGRQNESLEI